MTTFADLVTGVYNETKRPDLVTETANSIRKAVLKYHMADKWLPDLKSVVVPLTPLYPGDARFQIDTTLSPFVRFRDINSIRQYVNPPTPYNQQQLKRSEADDLLDESYGIEKTNYYYRAGTSINIRASFVWSNATVWYYQLPDVRTDPNFSSWIADLDPDAVIQEASVRLFAMIGKEQTARIYATYFNENVALLRQNYIVSGD